MPRQILLAAVVLCIVAIGPGEANSTPLSPDAEARLDRGEVVLLDRLPPGSHRPGQGGTAIVVVRASADAVWRVLVDYGGHRGLYPRVVGADVLEADAVHALVRYVVGVGPFSFGFHVNNYPDPGHRRLEWRLDRGRRNELFRDSWGYWEIEPHPAGVLLTYAMAADTVLPAFLTRGAERDGLVATLKAIRDRAERPD